MIYPIYVYGTPVLRKKAAEVPKDYPEIKQLAEDMFKTMYHADGVGLAAPQIGLSIRMFVIDISVMADEKHPEFKGAKRVFINPEIVERSEETHTQEEGCLSLPGITESVKRSVRVKVRYYDEDWNEKEEEFTDFFAKAVQHEYEHLDGHVFIDNISPIRRTMNRGRINAMLKGKVSCRYSVRTA